MTMKRKNTTPLCPCGSKRTYKHCCEKLHLGQPASSAEALMRSRYSSYALGLAEYLLKSWHPSTRPSQLNLDGSMQWFRLKILETSVCEHQTAIVSFEARYKINGKAACQSEVSEFVFENKHWFYIGAKG